MLKKIDQLYKSIEARYHDLSFENRLRIIGLITLILTLLLIMFTNPGDIGPLGVTLMLFFLYVLITTTILYLKNKRNGGHSTPAHKRRMVIKSAILGIPFIMLIALNTIHQLSLSDLIVVPIIYIVASFYINKRFNI